MVRLSLQLSPSSRKALPQVLPINYQYEVSSVIYRKLFDSNPEFAEWLHKEGLIHENRRFKFFTFSNLLIPQAHRKIKGDRIYIYGGDIRLIVSFAMRKGSDHFLAGLFDQQIISIGDHISRAEFQVDSVMSLPVPRFSESMRFRCLSPICISRTNHDKNGNRSTTYLSPEDPEYENRFTENLQHKFESLPHGGTLPEYNRITVKPASRPKSRLVTIKSGTPQETRVRGYLFEFDMHAPVPFMRLGYYAGFSEKNSTGFGCVEVKS